MSDLHLCCCQLICGFAADVSCAAWHDAFDLLVGKQVDSDGNGTVDKSEAYVYDGNQIVLRFAGTGSGNLSANNIKDRYLWGPATDQLMADEQVTSLSSAGTVNWALGDQENTIRDLVQYNGSTTSAVDHAQYDAFGNRLNTAAVDSVFGWTGRYRDADTSLQYNTERWYEIVQPSFCK